MHKFLSDCNPKLHILIFIFELFSSFHPVYFSHSDQSYVSLYLSFQRVGVIRMNEIGAARWWWCARAKLIFAYFMPQTLTNSRLQIQPFFPPVLSIRKFSELVEKSSFNSNEGQKNRCAYIFWFNCSNYP